MAFQKIWNVQCPECGHSLYGSVGTLGAEPEPGEPSVCGWCGALTIFTDDMKLRLLDYADWRSLSPTTKKSLLFTQVLVQSRVRAARQ
jgi:hypothetical protein